MTPDAPAPQRIPEERVAGILARAAELDRERRETISSDALRTAAIDAGISAVAVDAALAEYQDGLIAALTPVQAAPGPETRFARFRRFFRRLAGPSKLGTAMFMVGLTAAAGEGGIALGFVAWAAVALYQIVKRRPARRARGFILRLAVMTVSLALGFAVVEGDGDAIAALFAMSVPALIAGVLAIKVRLPRRFRSRAAQLQAPLA